MRELCIGAEVFEWPQSRMLDFRFDEKRGWFGQSQVTCVIVTIGNEFRGEGRTREAAAEAALETWESHFMKEGNEEAGSDGEVDESGYMGSQMFADRKGRAA